VLLRSQQTVVGIQICDKLYQLRSLLLAIDMNDINDEMMLFEGGQDRSPQQGQSLVEFPKAYSRWLTCAWRKLG
jgi:hypothetical protein